MTDDNARHKRHRWLMGAFLLMGLLVAIPAGEIALGMISQAVGRTTMATNPDGTQRTVYWRDYPGIAGVDPQKTLDGPTPEEGYAAGQGMVGELRSALSKELQLEWAAGQQGQSDADVFQERTTNWFGGESLLAIVNAPTSQSTGVPRAWGDKQRAIQIIGKVTARYGYEAPRLDTYDLWSDEDRIRELGGPTPETQVIVSGRALGPAGQWLSFTFQDPSKDKEGRFDERLWPTDGSFGQPNTLMLSYGANGLLHEADREEFKKRMEPFKGLTLPAPLDS
ncbi:hypothetical protein B1A87_007295 [Arthrobacter sp. KBS0703]|uniref:hypothetical protein n=1 Tax=Arthrobacter sp. KBS0703 TaxID=1955698 RepID=UPI0009901415|nr:hypothetical protein [Arthrobacter sp. KBS0703]TSE15730.1 hypothetical protein B1A87_007295 [Arthrobacter sp. KBS0703]